MTSKVRIACRRCRAKRIKCDGGVPACSNCQKADEVCLDVDGRNNAITIPRDFTANARARIAWLEEQLRRHAPHVSLDDGTKVDAGLQDVAAAPATLPSWPPEPETVPSKRPFDVAQSQNLSQEKPFATEARSVALDLGLLSLGSDSRQLHYLGTSSGRLFTSLIGVDLPENAGHEQSGTTPNPLAQPNKPGRPAPFANAKRHQETTRFVYSILSKHLPTREDTQVLLETYFHFVHPEYPFLHPRSVINAIEALYECEAAEPAAETGYNGWATTVETFTYNGEFAVSRGNKCTPISISMATFHVFMIFTLAATVRTRQRKYDFAPDQFYRAAILVAQECFINTSVATLQAILLSAVHSLLSPTETNIWTLTYTAMAQCIDLGLHRMPTKGDGMDGAAALTRKMAFFTVYHLDRSIATIQGRPLGIRDETFDIQLPSVHDVEADITNLTTSSLAPELSSPIIAAFSLHLLKLDPIISEIKLLFYHLPSQIDAYAWPSDHGETQKQIRQRLESWRFEARAWFDAHTETVKDQEQQSYVRRYDLMLQCQFFAATILLYQPSQMIPRPSEEALLTCYQCAAGRINVYNNLHNADGLIQGWRSVQGIFASGATMIYCLWSSRHVQRSIPLSESITDLRTCTNLLSVGGEYWPSVKRGKETFGRAMDALLKKLGHSQTSSSGQLTPLARHEQLERNTSRGTVGMAHQPESFGLGPQSCPPEATSFGEQQTAPPPGRDTLSTGAVMGWTASGNLENTLPQFELHGVDSTADADHRNLDSTVETFIADFLQNDTAWNPF